MFLQIDVISAYVPIFLASTQDFGTRAFRVIMNLSDANSPVPVPASDLLIMPPDRPSIRLFDDMKIEIYIIYDIQKLEKKKNLDN